MIFQLKRHGRIISICFYPWSYGWPPSEKQQIKRVTQLVKQTIFQINGSEFCSLMWTNQEMTFSVLMMCKRNRRGGRWDGEDARSEGHNGTSEVLGDKLKRVQTGGLDMSVGGTVLEGC